MVFKLEKNRKFDLITFGRACIDLNGNEYNRPMEETKTFTKYVGGSPANIAIGSAVLGLKVGFVGKISDDQHGRFIENYMRQVGVNTNGMVKDTEGRKVGLAFTEILSPQECSILLYREDVADLYIKPEEVEEAYIAQAKVLLISGTALAQSPSREAAFLAVQYAKNNNVKVALELDYRPYTWKSTLETSVYYRLLAMQADVVIGTRDEFNILENDSKHTDAKTVEALFKGTAQLIVIKHGVEGSYAYTREGEVIRGYAYKSNVLKTFGAGDSYAAGFFYGMLQGKTIGESLQYGSAAAAIVVSRHSSSEAMPTVEEIEKVMQQTIVT